MPLLAERQSPLYGRLTYHWFVPWQRCYASTTVRGFYELALRKANQSSEQSANKPASAATNQEER